MTTYEAHWQTECNQISREKARQRGRKLWSKRIWLILLAIIPLSMFATGNVLFQQGYLQQMQQHSNAWVNATLKAAGFRIKRIEISGLERLSSDAIVEQAGLKAPDASLLLSLADTKNRMLSHAHIADARIERVLPDMLRITIEERSPAALWQHQGEYRWLDRQGHRLSAEWVGEIDEDTIPVLTGPEIPEHISEFWQLRQLVGQMFSHVSTAQHVSGRRWNLWLDNGLYIALPAENPQQALKKLQPWVTEANIAGSGRIKKLDLRLPDRLFVTFDKEKKQPNMPDAAPHTITEQHNLVTAVLLRP